MANYSIKDLEKLSGIKAHTIRIWEKRYNIVQPSRTTTNIRYYCDDDLKKLLNISILSRHGFKISKLANLSPQQLNEKVIYLLHESGTYHNQIEHLISAMIDLDEKKFEKILSDSILKIGFEETVINIIYPFFEKIGILWQTGAIKPGQEHFVSNLLRQKLIVAIDGQMMNEKEEAKTFIIFLPEGEYHELGLLFYTYLIKKKGHKVIYLGQTVPFPDIEALVNSHKPDFLFTSLSSNVPEDNINDFIHKLSDKFSDIYVFITGYQASKLNELPENVYKITSPSQFFDQLKNKFNVSC